MQMKLTELPYNSMKKSLKICLYIAIGFAAILILSLVYKSLLNTNKERFPSLYFLLIICAYKLNLIELAFVI